MNIGEGWRPWCCTMPGLYYSPYAYDEVEAIRPEWDGPRKLTIANLDPGFNVADLYWRPFGELKPPINVYPTMREADQGGFLTAIFGPSGTRMF